MEKKVFCILLFVFVLCIAAGCVKTGSGSIGIVKGSGKASSETRELTEFTAVESNGSIDVEISPADTVSCTVKGDDNIVPLILTEVKDQCLYISAKQGYSTDMKLEVILEVPEITAAGLNGSGNITFSTVTKESVILNILGSGNISGNGYTKYLDANIIGSGDMLLEKLEAEHVSVEIKGSGNAFIQAKQSADMEILGSGNITCFGSPGDIKKNVEGSGKIIEK